MLQINGTTIIIEFDNNIIYVLCAWKGNIQNMND